MGEEQQLESPPRPKRGRPSLKEAQRKFREDTILDATQGLLAQKGYATMTLDDVMESVGISRASLYNHFRSKEDLAARVVVRAMEEGTHYLATQDPDLPAGDRVEAYVRWLIPKRFLWGIRLSDLAHSLRPSGDVHPEIARVERDLVDHLEGLVAQAQGEGTVRADVSKAVLVQTVIGAVQGYGYEGLLKESRIGIEEITEGIVRLLRPSMIV